MLQGKKKECFDAVLPTKISFMEFLEKLSKSCPQGEKKKVYYSLAIFWGKFDFCCFQLNVNRTNFEVLHILF